MTKRTAWANYGIDAPGVIRNLLLVAAAGLVIRATVAAGLWSGSIGNAVIRIELARPALFAAILCTAMAGWMIWDSTIGKIRGREALLNQLRWTGAERVLDVGCGRGLLLVGAARRLTTGTATGVDIWHAEDLSGNRPDAALENGVREGVADRMNVGTADMRDLPFPDATFDVVVSSVAIHNLYAERDRARAIAEIARVLKPGGQILIDDIRHYREYEKALTAANCVVRRTDAPAVSLLLTILTFGSVRPATLVATKG